MSAKRLKALIFGKHGQLAWELQRTAPLGWDVTALGSAEIDLLNIAQVSDVIGEIDPTLLINTAAYTAVDKAETEKELAFALNQQAVANIAEQCKTRPQTALVHVSTDFVFDGRKSEPYTAHDAANPASVYGASKRAGELEILNRQLPNSLILRTSWVYSGHGQNFVKTMLRLMGDPGREQLNVVNDQIGSPTWAFSLANAIWRVGSQLTASQPVGEAQVFNWTDAGVASWYDFAVAIQELALERGLLNRDITVSPISHTDYPTPAVRPSFSVLDKSAFEQAFGLRTLHWRKQLAAMLDELVEKAR